MKQNQIESIGIIGGGAFGTAIAHVAASAGRATTLWARDEKIVGNIRANHENPRYLPGIQLHNDLNVASDFPLLLKSSDLLFLGVPAKNTAEICRQIAKQTTDAKHIILLAKGIDPQSQSLLSDVVISELGNVSVAVLSGPSFASDIAQNLPTAVTIAAENIDDAFTISKAISTKSFRPYASDDLIGVQVGGALKNIFAIASGIVVGAGLGASASAALTTRSFSELQRLGNALGARTETLMGLSGLGDLILTCSSRQSRNFTFGIALGEGKTARDLTKPGMQLVEGVHSARIANDIALRHKLDLPILATVADIVDDKITVRDAINRLMTRPLKPEIGSNQTQERKRLSMAYWLFKSEPNTWSWQQQKDAGSEGAEWDGVRNYQARNNMREMALGDLGFFYHSINEKRVVGIVRVCKLAHPDSTSDDERWECVDVEAVCDVPEPVTLDQVKADDLLSQMVLANNSRLSVQPVSKEEWVKICTLGKVDPIPGT